MAGRIPWNTLVVTTTDLMIFMIEAPAHMEPEASYGAKGGARGGGKQ